MTLIHRNANLLQRNSLYAEAPVAVSTGQVALDALQESFVSHASDWRTLTSMVVAGSFGKALLCVRPSFANLIGNSGARLFSQAFSLSGESIAFEAMQRTLNPHFISGNFLGNCESHFIHFGVLRASGLLGVRNNPFLQLSLESSAMVLGQNLAFQMGRAENPHASLAEQWVSASVFALQNRAGLSLFHSLSSGRLEPLERAWQWRREISSQPRLCVERQNLPNMASSDPIREAKARYRAALQEVIDREDYSRYHKVIPEVLPVGHSLSDLIAWTRIRWQRDRRRSLHAEEPTSPKSSLVGVCILIRDSKGRVLVTLDRDSRRGLPRVPSESLEPTDQSVGAAALRGIAEELGAQANLSAHIARVSVRFSIAGRRLNLRHYYLVEAQLIRGEEGISLPPNGEIKAVDFVAPSPNLRFSPEGMYAGLDRALNGVLADYLARSRR